MTLLGCQFDKKKAHTESVRKSIDKLTLFYTKVAQYNEELISKKQNELEKLEGGLATLLLEGYDELYKIYREKLKQLPERGVKRTASDMQGGNSRHEDENSPKNKNYRDLAQR